MVQHVRFKTPKKKHITIVFVAKTTTCFGVAMAQGMLYFLDESPGGSWADGTLKALGYDRNPEKLQTVMRRSALGKHVENTVANTWPPWLLSQLHEQRLLFG
jgi:hypothetical protein